MHKGMWAEGLCSLVEWSRTLEYTLHVRRPWRSVYFAELGFKVTVRVCGWSTVAGIEVCVSHFRLSYYMGHCLLSVTLFKFKGGKGW